MKTPITDEMIESRRNRGMTLEYAIKLCRKLETENAELRDALSEIANSDKTPFTVNPREGICPYGCDAPNIAQNALANSKRCHGKAVDIRES
jgi:hypothetical protein